MNYYELLEINESASQEVIKAAYRALAKKYHPDTFKGSATEREKSMAELNAAFDVLSDPIKRKKYDESLKLEETQDNTGNMNNNETYCYENNYAEEVNDYQPEQGTSGWGIVGNFFKSLGKEILNDVQKNVALKQNAYLEGIRMGNYSLVHRFKSSQGFERLGYAKALEERGILRKDENGNYTSTDKFKWLF